MRKRYLQFEISRESSPTPTQNDNVQINIYLKADQITQNTQNPKKIQKNPQVFIHDVSKNAKAAKNGRRWNVLIIMICTFAFLISRKKMNKSIIVFLQPK